MGKTPKTPEILETEWDLLDALWTLERGTARQVTEHLGGKRGWAYSTVKTLLDRMVVKGLVTARQVGHVWEFTPAVPRHKAQRWAWRRLVDVAFKGALAPTVAFVTRESKLSKHDRAELRALLDRLEEETD
jgi:BlaI family penicillinase repressor